MAHHEAILYQKLPNGAVRCQICPRRCLVAPGQRGFCRARENTEGIFYAITYGFVSSLAMDPIEKKPLYHFHPGSQCLSVGSLGCNLRCLHCQNWSISQADPTVSSLRSARELTPEALLGLALSNRADGLAWTYNEPTLWLEYAIDCARLAKSASLYTVFVTNGYITEEALEALAPWLDAYRVDLKGWDAEFWRKLAQVPDPRPIFQATRQARHRHHLHVEAVTNVIPGWNDNEATLRPLARWIAQELGPMTPWHLTRFFPSWQLEDRPITPVSSLELGERIGHDEGLQYIYLGNLGDRGENTFCPSCGTLLLERSGMCLVLSALTEDQHCPRCGLAIPIVGAVQSPRRGGKAVL
jgi:pyruvate formate lyase activating enzyme